MGKLRKALITLLSVLMMAGALPVNADDSASLIDITNKNKDAKPAGNAVKADAGYHDMLDGDYVYIKDFSIEDIMTGQGPFDKDDTDGNDSSESNDRVRSFDHLSYSLLVTADSYAANQKKQSGTGTDDSENMMNAYFKNGYIWYKFVLPVSYESAHFDLDAMGWMTAGEYNASTNPYGYTYEKSGNSQTLICSQYLNGSAAGRDSVFPCVEQSADVEIIVQSMPNKSTVQPTMYAWIDHNNNNAYRDDSYSIAKGVINEQKDQHPLTADNLSYTRGRVKAACEAHANASENGGYEMWYVQSQPIVVTAKQSMDVVMTQQSRYANYDHVNFNVGKSYNGQEAPNKGAGTLSGTMFTFGSYLALQNTGDSNRGLRGIEFPSGDITFDIYLTPSYLKIVKGTDGGAQTDKDGNVVAKAQALSTDEATPYLYYANTNKTTAGDDYGRGLDVSSMRSEAAYPWIEPIESDGNYNYYSVYKSGNVIAKQEVDKNGKPVMTATGEKDSDGKAYYANKVTITIKNYSVDINHMPVANYGDEKTANRYYDSWEDYDYNNNRGYGAEYINTGVFSALCETFMLNYDYDTILKNHDIGSIVLTAEAKNIKYKTASNADGQDISDGNNKQVASFGLRWPGTYDNEMWYSSRDSYLGHDVRWSDQFPVYAWGTPDDNTYIGDQVLIDGGFRCNNTSKWYNYGADTLTKFDASAFSVIGAEGSNYSDYWTDDVWYASKPDGSNWKDFNEQKAANIGDLKFYHSMDELLADTSGLAQGVTQRQCVGIMNSYRAIEGKFIYGHVDDILGKTRMQVTGDMSKGGKVYGIVESSNIWQYDPEQYMSEDGTFHNPDGLKAFGDGVDATTHKWTNTGDKETYPNFKLDFDKCVWENGRVTNTETWHLDAGDNMYLMPYKAEVAKRVSQVSASGDRYEVFNINNGFDVIDYEITPAFRKSGYIDPSSGTTTITYVDTLPVGLEYNNDAAYGGQYQQADIRGLHGTLIGGSTDGLTENIEDDYDEVKNSDGTVTKKANGGKRITWTLTGVSLAEDPPKLHYSCSIKQADVKNNERLTNSVSIQTTEDNQRELTQSNQNVSKCTIRVSKQGGLSLTKRAAKSIEYTGDDLEWKLNYNNYSKVKRKNVVMADSLPGNGQNGSSYHGDYSIKNINMKINGVTVKPEDDQQTGQTGDDTIAPDQFLLKTGTVKDEDGKNVNLYLRLANNNNNIALGCSTAPNYTDSASDYGNGYTWSVFNGYLINRFKNKCYILAVKKTYHKAGYSYDDYKWHKAYYTYEIVSDTVSDTNKETLAKSIQAYEANAGSANRTIYSPVKLQNESGNYDVGHDFFLYTGYSGAEGSTTWETLGYTDYNNTLTQYNLGYTTVTGSSLESAGASKFSFETANIPFGDPDINTYPNSETYSIYIDGLGYMALGELNDETQPDNWNYRYLSYTDDPDQAIQFKCCGTLYSTDNDVMYMYTENSKGTAYYLGWYTGRAGKEEYPKHNAYEKLVLLDTKKFWPYSGKDHGYDTYDVSIATSFKICPYMFKRTETGFDAYLEPYYYCEWAKREWDHNDPNTHQAVFNYTGQGSGDEYINIAVDETDKSLTLLYGSNRGSKAAYTDTPYKYGSKHTYSWAKFHFTKYKPEWTVYYTTNEKYRGQNLNNLTSDKLENSSDWTNAGVVKTSDQTDLPIPSNAAAFAIVGPLMPQSSLSVDVACKTNKAEAGDTYINASSMRGVTVKAKIKYIKFSVSGMVFYDNNVDGLYTDGDSLDKKLAGVTATLYKRSSPHVPGTNNENIVENSKGQLCTMKTDKNGEYRFDYIPASDYDVVFTDGDVTLGSYEDVTKKNVVNKESDKAANSRAILLNKDVKSDGSQTVKSAMVRGIMDAGDLVKTKDSSGNEISWDIQHVNLGLVNPTKVKISKRAQKTKTSTGGALANAKMQVLDEKGNIIDSYTSTGSAHTVDLQAGKTYTIKEISAPDGYEVADPKTFTLVDSDGNKRVDNVVSVNGSTAKVMWDAGSTVEIQKQNGLLWTIVKVSDAGNHTLRASTAADEKAGTAKTSYQTTGIGESIKLENGTYRIHETVSAYKNNTVGDCEFTIGGKDTEFKVQRKLTGKDAINIEDPIKTIEPHFSNGGKIDPSNKALYGAILQIKHGTDVLYEWATDGKDPHISLDAGSTYILHEAKAPMGYSLTDDIEFSIKPDGTITTRDGDNREEKTINSLVLKDAIIHKNIRIWKVNEEGVALGGVKMKIFSEDGNEFDSWTTEANSSHMVYSMSAGQIYTLHEEEMPDSMKEKYELAADKAYYVAMDGNMWTAEKLSLSNGSLTVNYEPGAELQLLDSSGKIVDDWGTGNKPYTISGLKDGTYTIREVNSPADMAVKYSGSTKTVVNEPENKMADFTFTVVNGKIATKNTVKASKTLLGGMELKVKWTSGALLELIESGGSVIKTWISDGTEQTIDGLDASKTYQLHEIDASAGLTEETKDISIKAGSEASVTKTYSGNAWMLRKGSTEHMYMIDPYSTIPLAIRKVVKGHTDRYVNGAVLQVLDRTGKPVSGMDKLATNSKEPVIVKLKKNAVYTLHESTVPKGYCQAEDITFRVNFDGSVQLKTGTDKQGNAVYGNKILSTYTYKGAKVVSIDMIDAPLQNLPNSGGHGAVQLIIFTSMGMILAFVAMQLIKARKK